MSASNSTGTPATEKRQSPRRRTLKTGIVIYGGYLFVLNCSVRDLSTEGAQLRFTPGTAVPDRFVLVLPSDDVVFEAMIVRRSGNEVGVRFEGKGVPVNEADQRVKRFYSL